MKLKPNQFEYRPGLILTERPISFMIDMVQATLAGRKTQTRRLLKPQPNPYGTELIDSGQYWNKGKGRWHNRFKTSDNPERYEIASLHDCPHGQPGDLLWVREKMIKNINSDTHWPCADGYKKTAVYEKTVPSIHMPKAAARIWMMIEDIRVERVQEISEEDAMAEGISPIPCPLGGPEILGYKNYYNGRMPEPPLVSFHSLWVSINGLESWQSNPWVWVIKFRVLSTTGKPEVKTILQAYTDITSKLNTNHEHRPNT